MTESAYCREHAEKIDQLHDDVKDIAGYVPKIEIALERLLCVQDTLKSYADVHKEIFRTMRKITDELTALKLDDKDHQSRIKSLEEMRRSTTSFLTPIGSAIILALLGAVAALVVSHGVKP